MTGTSDRRAAPERPGPAPAHGEAATARRVVPAVFSLSALVGADDLRLALVLAAVDPRIGGVLLRGDKGSGKTTAARGLAALLPGDAPFVELPLGATEDRVVGSLDVRAALGTGEYAFRPGLLQAADGGVLYVDEVNLLADHLVDLLLDAAATGVVRVERDAVSETRPARFVLVGSMNPEEGELRPQLLDRFGLSVAVGAPADPADRAEAVRRRLEFDRDPAAAAPARGPPAWRAAAPDALLALAADVDSLCRLAVESLLPRAAFSLALPAPRAGTMAQPSSTPSSPPAALAQLAEDLQEALRERGGEFLAQPVARLLVGLERLFRPLLLARDRPCRRGGRRRGPGRAASVARGRDGG